MNTDEAIDEAKEVIRKAISYSLSGDKVKLRQTLLEYHDQKLLLAIAVGSLEGMIKGRAQEWGVSPQVQLNHLLGVDFNAS